MLLVIRDGTEAELRPTFDMDMFVWTWTGCEAPQLPMHIGSGVGGAVVVVATEVVVVAGC